MFDQLAQIVSRPAPFEFYTVDALWTDAHTSKKMLEYHLDDSTDAASRNTRFMDRSVEWIVAQFGPGPGKTVADFGCGPGLYTTRLARRGFTVTGIDFSENSLRYARRSAADQELTIDYCQANYLEFDTSDRFDLIIMISCDYCALSPEQRSIMLGKFHSLLNPGGHLLLDVQSVNRFDLKEESATYEWYRQGGFWSPEEHFSFVNTSKYEAERVTVDKYTIVERGRTRTIYNWLQYFSEISLREEFEQHGFEVQALYADVAGTPLAYDSPEMAIVARK